MNELQILLEGIKVVRAEMTTALNRRMEMLMAAGENARDARAIALSSPAVQEAHGRLLNLYALIETKTAV